MFKTIFLQFLWDNLKMFLKTILSNLIKLNFKFINL